METRTATPTPTTSCKDCGETQPARPASRNAHPVPNTTTRYTFKAATSDLQGAAEAAILHFHSVGLNDSTFRAWALNARDAGLKIKRNGNTFILSH